MKEILVYADWVEFPQRSFLGKLRAQLVKGEEVFSFEYDSDWLKSGLAQELDPDLRLYRGPQYLGDDKPNFGLFLDSSPDRWGRMLITRREAIRARAKSTKPKKLVESDFLLRIHDETRMGALRFKLEEHGEFLAYDSDEKVPPVSSIRELEEATRRIEDDDFFEDSDARKWLQMLLVPGSSLGGARPKANVRDTDQSLWIAKFPSKNDDKDTGLWEFVVNQLARKCDINVADAKVARHSQKQHTFLTKRFDRSTHNDRRHFASAMTLLGYKDGHGHKDGGTYLDLLELIERYGANPEDDIRELWKRIVFSVGVSNTDDHLRNHGFILTRKGWKLSPAYDINPNEKGIGLSLNISEDDNSLDYDLCLEVAQYFRWPMDEAKNYIINVKSEISEWHQLAKNLAVPKRELRQMESAFRF